MNFPLPSKVYSSLGFQRKDTRVVVLALWKSIVDDEILTRAAAISFYAMLAFVPFIGVLFSIAIEIFAQGNFLNLQVEGVQQQAFGALEKNLQVVIPKAGYLVVLEQIHRMQASNPVALLSLGSVFSLWASSSLFMAVMDALNRIYSIKETSRYWQRRAIAMSMTIIQSVILMTSLITIVCWPQILNLLGLRDVAAVMVSVIHFIFAFGTTVIAFALTFQIRAHCTQRTAWVTPGSFLGSIVFLAGSYCFRLYVQSFGTYSEVYGSLGGIIVLMLWFYVSGVVLLSAAALNKVLDEAP
ncbi:MAG: YihY/virulence factor BrkB family protein [Candidatus Melainabacteria bacterium]|nr:YihY/virulence factor BrkB family protein [Candidatus Melainabacteria bacterium]